MIKCYGYNEHASSGGTELKNGSVVELISPTEHEIDAVVKFSGVNGDHLRSLVNGDFKHDGNEIGAVTLNGALNVIISGDYILAARGESSVEYPDLIRVLQTIGQLISAPGTVSLSYEDISDAFFGVTDAYASFASRAGADKTDAGTVALNALPAENKTGMKWYILSVISHLGVNLEEIESLTAKFHESVGKDSNIIWGTFFDDELTDEIRVTLIATHGGK